MNIKILVATHKQYWMPEDSVYMPIHVGREGKEDLGYIGDNTGDNISLKNPNYCELTALYWAWKNLDADYIGLCHYRRYFMSKNNPFFVQGDIKDILSYAEYKHILSKTDIIVSQKRHYYIETMWNQYIHAHNEQDLIELETIIRNQYPGYYNAFENLKTRKWAHMFNMFVMKRDKYDAYCEWLFSVLFSLESKLEFIEPRLFGFLSERLLDVWLEANNYSYSEVPVSFMENQDWIGKVLNFIKRKFGVHNG